MSTVATGVRRANRAGERRRVRVLREAERLVRELGHPNVTIAMIAEAAEVTQPAVHYHFSSRDELFVELLRYRDSHAPELVIDDGIEALVAAVRASEATPTLAALFADYATRARDPEHPAHDYISLRYRWLTEQLEISVRRRQADGLTAPDIDANATAVLILAIADGLQTRWLIDPSTPMGDEMVTAVASLLHAPR